MSFRVKKERETGYFYIVDENQKASEELNKFLRAFSIRGLSPLTIRSYAFDLVVIYRWMAATDRNLAALRLPDLLEFISHERERNIHPSSINRRLTTCRQLFEFWHPEGLSVEKGTSLPAPYYRVNRRDMPLPKNKTKLVLSVKVPQKQIVPLLAEQVHELLRSIRRYRDCAIVYLMLLCGLRSIEILRLKRQDVSLIERHVKVWGKGDKERFIPLPELATTFIEKYIKYERPENCDDALFVCLQGKRRGYSMTPAGLRSLFRRLRKKPKLANANPHRLRHTFGADMARCGIQLPVLQRLMGHANYEITLRYINLSMTDIADAFRVASAEIQKRYDSEG